MNLKEVPPDVLFKFFEEEMVPNSHKVLREVPAIEKEAKRISEQLLKVLDSKNSAATVVAVEFIICRLAFHFLKECGAKVAQETITDPFIIKKIKKALDKQDPAAVEAILDTVAKSIIEKEKKH